MHKLFPRAILFSRLPLLLLVAACGDGNPGATKTDGGDAAEGAAATGGTIGTGGTVGGGSGGIAGAGGVGPGTGGSILGSGGSSSGTCAGGACPTDAGAAEGDVPSPTEQSCAYDGRTYPHLTTWWAPDGCNECACLNGHAGCSLIGCPDGGRRSYSCEHNGKSYASGATFAATDGCNVCECAFFWYRGNPPGPIFVSCTSKDCSAPAIDAGVAVDAGIDACVYGGKTYPLDVYFPSADGCDECHCRSDGQVTCTFAHIGCRKDAGAADVPLDSAVAPG